MQRFVYQLFIIISILTVSKTYAQELKWSQPQKMSERNFISEVVGQNGEGIFVVRKSYRQPERNAMLEIYTNDMKMLRSKALATNKNEYFVQIIMLPNMIRFFYATENAETRETELRAKTYDFNLAELGKDTVLLKMPGPDIADRKMHFYKPVTQQQSLILYTKQTLDIPSSYNYLVIDSALKVLASGEFTYDIKNDYEIENAVFTGSHVAILIRENVKRKINKQGYEYYIAEQKFGDTKTSMTALYTDSITVTEGLLRADYLNNNIVFAGLYNLKDSSYAKGYYLRTHILNSGQVKTSHTVFPKRVIEELSGKTTRIQGIYNLRSGDMLLRKDGGVVLTSEEYEETREAVMDMNMYGTSTTNFRYYYYYDNILILSINPDGSLDWHTVLRKKQMSVNDNGVYSSYVVSAMADKLVYIYNDLDRKSWNLSRYEVTSDGVANNKIILRAEDYNAKLVPQYARQIGYDEVIIPGLSNKGYVLLKVKL